MGWKPALQAIAQGLDREEQAQQVIAAHDQHIEATRQKIAPLSSGKTIIGLGWEPTANQSFVFDRTFITNLLEDLGFQVVMAGSSETNLSMETVAKLESDHILIMPTGDNTIERAKQQWETNPILRSIPAAKAGKLYFMDYQLARIRGPIAAEIFLNEFAALVTQQQSQRRHEHFLLRRTIASVWP
jgi:iron complex transport system substrate-binding protein